MKKISLAILYMALFQLSQAQKNVAGTWEGKLSVSVTTLRLVVHLKNDNGNYSATIDSPDQGAKGIAASRVTVAGDSLHLELAAANAKLSGEFTTDSTFNGTWYQGAASLPLPLRKLAAGESIAEAKRPQTPKAPFPYESKDVIYYNKEKSIQYGATITKPGGAGPFPAVLLITGSGQQNRDEELFDHKPFAVIADYLTRKGYLVLRVDDRGVGQTTGDVKSATSKDFADDAVVGLDYLKTLPEADKSKLGLLGHSEGGMIAEMIAAQRNDLSFVVLLAAPGVPIIDLMTEQNRSLLQAGGLSKEQVESYLQLYKTFVVAYTNAASDSAAKTAAQKVVDEWTKKTPPDVVQATTGIKDEKSKEAFISAFGKGINTPWFRYFFHYNPDAYVKKIRAKVLALNGDKDIQVASKTNLAALKTSLQKSPSKSFDVIEMKGLNHLFQHCTKCTVAEYGELEETIAPETLQKIGDWLAKNVK